MPIAWSSTSIPARAWPWATTVAASQELRNRLGNAGLATFCRTTGGKGLHVVAPLVPGADWDSVRAWSRSFAEDMEREFPDRFVASVPKARRKGKILLDWLRNGLGSTAVASFSPRARPGAMVATPLAWREVTAKLDPASFTIGTRAQSASPGRRVTHGRGSRQRHSIPSPPRRMPPNPGGSADGPNARSGGGICASPSYPARWRFIRGPARFRLAAFPLHQSGDGQPGPDGDAGWGNRGMSCPAATWRGGFEYEKDHYVLLDEADFEQARIDSFRHADRRQVRAGATRSTRSITMPATTWCAGWPCRAGRLRRAARCHRQNGPGWRCPVWSIRPAGSERGGADADGQRPGGAYAA